MSKMEKTDSQYTFEDLVKIMERLRGDDGCPWDREQTHDSIKNAAVEEAYELLEAINNRDTENIREELGDLLLQVVFHSQMAKEEGTFDLGDVIHGLATKLVYRHPHVFGEVSVSDSGEVLDNWDALKLKEKSINSVTEDMKKVPRALPSMTRARKIQKKASKVGMDFEHAEEVFHKIDEETAELREAMISEDPAAVEEEFGDLLFGIVNLSRFLGLNPENALTNALEKFINRFEGVENLAKARNIKLSGLSADELDQLWEEVKSSNDRASDY